MIKQGTQAVSRHYAANACDVPPIKCTRLQAKTDSQTNFTTQLSLASLQYLQKDFQNALAPKNVTRQGAALHHVDKGHDGLLEQEYLQIIIAGTAT
jgi:hypothetical protein